MCPYTVQSNSKVVVSLEQNRMYTQHLRHLTQRGEKRFEGEGDLTGLLV